MNEIFTFHTRMVKYTRNVTSEWLTHFVNRCVCETRFTVYASSNLPFSSKKLITFNMKSKIKLQLMFSQKTASKRRLNFIKMIFSLLLLLYESAVSVKKKSI